MKTLLFDDTYEGPRWTYGLSLRPFGYAQVPDGAIVFSLRTHPRYRYGTIQYPFPLDAAVARQADLEELR
jgi:hypothetical protein